jgi:bacillopeptidase F (M6 metalloprotease family)
LTSPPLALTAGETSSFSFWTLYDIEPGWDGGVVEISADGGGTWSQLALVPPYPGSFNDGADGCGLPAGTPSFTGSQLAWVEHWAALSPWNGQTVRLRFRFSTNATIADEGWYVDDLAVTHAQVPGACEDGLLFRDGFESGDTGAWALAVGG